MDIRSSTRALPPPTLADAHVSGDPSSGDVLVLVGPGVAFPFTLTPAGWTAEVAMTAGRGVELSEAWLSSAREVAAEALRRASAAEGAAPDVDTIRCEDCGKVLCARELRGAGAVKVLFCAPSHVVTFESGRSLRILHDGGAEWWP